MSKRLKLPHEGTYYYVAPWKTRQTPTAPSQVQWCKTEAYSLSEKHNSNLPKRVRCPDCGRLLTVMMVDIESGYGDFWRYLPPHKRCSIELVKQKAHQRRMKKKEKFFRR